MPLGDYQDRVHDWMLKCFGHGVTYDHQERSYRFLEEALELVQALDCSKEDALRLVDYVYGRPKGEINQEIGGVAVCLAALSTAAQYDTAFCAEAELRRVNANIEKIRAKHAAKTIRGPLPGELSSK